MVRESNRFHACPPPAYAETLRAGRQGFPLCGTMFKVWRRVGWVICGLLFFVASCGGESVPPPPPKGGVPKAVAKKVEPVKVADQKEPEKKEEQEYQYNPTGKPDPFKPFIQLTPIREGIRTTPLTPLQKYDISQLKLVAIIAAPEGNIALVEDSAGKGYFVKRGTEIGKNEGKVTKILKDRVIIEELYLDVWGQAKKSEVSLFLHKIEEGGES
ncbi:MAG: pilus assembly protein PilP [Thermodesulfobacteriota bacterium]|nr:pilus assembly protein PilP [Thermodesulfobacteriota bacterium]